MENFKFYAPTEVVFGKEVENQTGETAKKHGTKALLVFGKGSVVKSGLLERVEKSLSEAGVEYQEFGGAKPNPTLAHAKEGISAALSFGADMIIGIGGGSAHKAENQHRAKDSFHGKYLHQYSRYISRICTASAPVARARRSSMAAFWGERLSAAMVLLDPLA